MKFIIYGAGYRGRRLLHYLGDNWVTAFIDSDIEKYGTKIDGKIVISLEEYKKKYFSIPIIVSPSNYAEIIKKLMAYDIHAFSLLSELPSEFSGYGLTRFSDCYKKLLKKYNRPCYLYGINAFSLLLFYELLGHGNEVYFLEGAGRMAVWVEKHAPEHICDVPVQDANIFLCCYTDIKSASNKYVAQHLIDFYDYTSNLPVYYNQNIEKFKNMYSDKKRCFIVATGPSLRESDLQRLMRHGEFCFGVNKIFKMNSAWHPNVYVATDSFLIKEEQAEIIGYDADVKFIGDGNVLSRNKDNTHVIHVVGSGHGEYLPPFSEDVAQKVYGAGTVVYACIQIAVYMGLRYIYLLGVDCNYEFGSKGNHFYIEENPDVIERDLSQMTLAFQAARNYASTNGIKIYNATRGGNLDIFERVDFDDLF